MRICEIVSRMAYVNLLWIIFTILGLGILGIMPATVGLFTVTRKWVMNEQDIPVFRTFWKTFRKEFIKANLLGGILFAIGYILYIDLTYLPSDGLFVIVRWLLIVCALLYVIILLYIFPIYVQYEWKKRLYIKYALLLGASHPHYTLLMIIGIIALYYISITIQGLIPFFSVALLSYIVMWTAYQVMKRVEAGQSFDDHQSVSTQIVEAE
jgi:uncharacterized membrane protein YesL